MRRLGRKALERLSYVALSHPAAFCERAPSPLCVASTGNLCCIPGHHSEVTREAHGLPGKQSHLQGSGAVFSFGSHNVVVMKIVVVIAVICQADPFDVFPIALGVPSWTPGSGG